MAFIVHDWKLNATFARSLATCRHENGTSTTFPSSSSTLTLSRTMVGLAKKKLVWLRDQTVHQTKEASKKERQEKGNKVELIDGPRLKGERKKKTERKLC